MSLVQACDGLLQVRQTDLRALHVAAIRRQAVFIPRHKLLHTAAVLIKTHKFREERLTTPIGVVELLARLTHEPFNTIDLLFGPQGVTGPFVEARHLRVHAGHHFVQAVRGDDGLLDGMFLLLEHLGFLCDVFGERVERTHPFVERARHILQARQAGQLLLDLTDRRCGRFGVVTRLAGRDAEPLLVGGQSCGHLAHGDQTGVGLKGGFARLVEIHHRALHVGAQQVQRLAFFGQRVEGGPRLQRLRSKLLGHLPLFLGIGLSGVRGRASGRLHPLHLGGHLCEQGGQFRLLAPDFFKESVGAVGLGPGFLAAHPL